MEQSILTSTKKVLGLDKEFVEFDQDILTHINAAFSTLAQIGVGEPAGFFITDEEAVWGDLSIPDNQLNAVKSWLYLVVRNMFDPPDSSFVLKANQEQIAQFEWRLRVMAEEEDLEESA